MSIKLLFSKFISLAHKRKRLLFLVVLCLVVAGVTMPQITSAAWSWNPANWIGDAKATVANGFLLILGSIPLITTGLFSFVSSTLLIWVLGISIRVVSYTSTDPILNPAISVGWPIVRNFANIFVVVGLIAIAMATILRFKNYEAKQLLAKLIIAAVLVNFSLVICDIVIDISNITMAYILAPNGNLITLGNISTSEWDHTKTIFSEGFGSGPDNSPMIFMAKISGQIFFNVMKGIIGFIYIFLFLFRIMALWILVILSPLAFVCAVFPGKPQEIWKKWLDNFLQWCFVGILGAFFLFLGTKIQAGMVGMRIAPPLPVASDPFLQPLTSMFTFLVPGMFLIIGFIFSLQVSAMGASTAASLGKKVGLGAAKFTGSVNKWAADNAGLTRIKDRAVYGLTRAGESMRIFHRGTAAKNWEAKNSAVINDKDRTARANAMTDQELQQELSNPRSFLSTVEGQKDRAAMLNVMEKRKKLSMLNPADQMEALRISSKYQQQEDTQKVVANMSAESKRRIVAGEGNYEQTVRDAALGSLAEKGQINTIDQADLTPALQRSLDNGMDVENIVKALDKTHLEDLLAQGLFDPNAVDRLFDDKTRNKILKTIADKKLMSIMDADQKLDALLESRTQQYQPKDVLSSMESNDLAKIINTDMGNTANGYDAIFDEQTRSTAANSLLKRGDLDLVKAVHRENTVEEMVNNGVDIEDIEKLDHNYAPFNRGRIKRLRDADPGQTDAEYAQRAKNEVLDRDFTKKDSDQLRNLSIGDITLKRIKQLTPEKLEAAYQYASTAVKNHLQTPIYNGLLGEWHDASDAYNDAIAATEPAKAEKALERMQKLERLMDTIFDL